MFESALEHIVQLQSRTYVLQINTGNANLFTLIYAVTNYPALVNKDLYDH